MESQKTKYRKAIYYLSYDKALKISEGIWRPGVSLVYFFAPQNWLGIWRDDLAGAISCAEDCGGKIIRPRLECEIERPLRRLYRMYASVISDAYYKDHAYNESLTPHVCVHCDPVQAAAWASAYRREIREFDPDPEWQRIATRLTSMRGE
jgi:hypothetical protein